MTWFGTRHAPVRDPLEVHDDADHRRALVLSEVAAEGPAGLFRVLRRAGSGEDADAAGIRVSGLIRALPGMTMPTSHDLLLRAHIRESALAGELTPGQRVALVSVVDRTQHPYARPRV
ncbi:hypothetical protein [Streptomyces sp. IBSBF 2435]|uniref:hypothetical protein n=1 Tax=Streptomyces sp. IBSBF 2435 TaxID=2903531 RepID=UPI002FDBA325